MIYLYVKTHKSGLKYLGKTAANDPHKYPGSGKYWKLHCNKHGYEYDTTILFESEDPTEIREKGIYYSQLWDVVKSKDWANLKEEQGDGGAMIHTAESNQRRSETMKKRSFTDEHRKNLSISGKGHADNRSPESLASFKAKASAKLKGRILSEEHKANMRGKGKSRTEEQKAHLKEKWTDDRKQKQGERTRLQNLARQVITCPHCGITGQLTKIHAGSCKGLHPKIKKQTGRLKQDRRSFWLFLSPDNIPTEVTNLRKFCRDNKLNNGSMCEIASGNRKTHRGWRLG